MTSPHLHACVQPPREQGSIADAHNALVGQLHQQPGAQTGAVDAIQYNTNFTRF